MVMTTATFAAWFIVPVEERAEAAEFVVPPVLEEAFRLRGDPPVLRVGEGAPMVHLVTDSVDDGRRVVFLCRCRQFLNFHGQKFRLNGSLPFLAALLLRLGDGGDEVGAASEFRHLLGRLPRRVQLPMPYGTLVG